MALPLPASSNPKLRWYQFSMRTLLVVNCKIHH